MSTGNPEVQVACTICGAPVPYDRPAMTLPTCSDVCDRRVTPTHRRLLAAALMQQLPYDASRELAATVATWLTLGEPASLANMLEAVERPHWASRFGLGLSTADLMRLAVALHHAATRAGAT